MSRLLTKLSDWLDEIWRDQALVRGAKKEFFHVDLRPAKTKVFAGLTNLLSLLNE